MARDRLETVTRTVATVKPLADLLSARGFDTAAWLAPAGFSPADLDRLEHRISLADSVALVEDALVLTGDPALGLHVVENVTSRATDLFTYLAATSNTGREAFEAGTRYVEVAGSDFEFSLEVRSGRSIVSTRSAITDGAQDRFFAEVTVGLMVKFGRIVAGALDASAEAWFAYPAPDYADEYGRVLELPIRFDAPCHALSSSADRLDAPLPRADSRLQELLEQHARRLYEALPRSDCFADRVRDAILAELPSGDPGADHIAQRLHLSTRTLRRRLRHEGTTHRELLDAVRSELARSYLASRELGASEVAFLLGFSDTSAFHKAFRRWTGLSPAAWLDSNRG